MVPRVYAKLIDDYRDEWPLEEASKIFVYLQKESARFDQRIRTA